MNGKNNWKAKLSTTKKINTNTKAKYTQFSLIQEEEHKDKLKSIRKSGLST